MSSCASEPAASAFCRQIGPSHSFPHLLVLSMRYLQPMQHFPWIHPVCLCQIDSAKNWNCCFRKSHCFRIWIDDYRRTSEFSRRKVSCPLPSPWRPGRRGKSLYPEDCRLSRVVSAFRCLCVANHAAGRQDSLYTQGFGRCPDRGHISEFIDCFTKVSALLHLSNCIIFAMR